jgi:L-asparaginase
MNTETWNLWHRRLIAVTVVSIAAAFFTISRAQEIPSVLPPGVKLPHVVLMSMGGTIASKATDRMNINNYGGRGMRVDPQDWVDALPELAQVARVSVEDMRPPEPPEGAAPTAGGGTTFEQLYKVARRLQAIANDASIDGVVVTHGTNTMAESAWFMDLVVNIKKPVVFVGSQRPWTGISGDGPLNLYNAIRVAASPDAVGKGVLHAMNQNINPARDVVKSSAYRVDTFKSTDLGVIGVIDPDKVVFHTEPLRRHTYKSEFNIALLPEQLPEVEVLYAYTESPGYLVDALVEHGVKGIIIDGTGAGSPGGGQSEAIKRAQAKGVVVVAVARTRGGRVQDTPRRREAKIVPGDNFQPEKARMLLQMALTKTTDLKEITRIFNEY